MGLFQGCSDGFWKNNEDLWVGFSPDDIYDEVFGVDFFGLLTLSNVIGTGGGGLVALGRQSVGALLNAANPNIIYEFTVEEVIDLVQGIDPTNTDQVNDLKNSFEFNNNLGSPFC